MNSYSQVVVHSPITVMRAGDKFNSLTSIYFTVFIAKVNHLIILRLFSVNPPTIAIVIIVDDYTHFEQYGQFIIPVFSVYNIFRIWLFAITALHICSSRIFYFTLLCCNSQISVVRLEYRSKWNVGYSLPTNRCEFLQCIYFYH